MEIHHIGYLVSKIDEAIIEFQKLGFEITNEKVFDEIRNAFICFMKNKECLIELISPDNKESVVYNLLKKYKNTPYHICYETENIQQKIDELIKSDYMLFQEPTVAPAIGSKRVAFLMNKDIGIIELVEK